MRESQNPYAILIALLAAMWIAIGIIAICHAEESKPIPQEECWVERNAWIDNNGDKQIELNIYCSPIDNPEVFDIVYPSAV